MRTAVPAVISPRRQMPGSPRHPSARRRSREPWRSGSEPSFTQTEGQSITNIASYRAIEQGLPVCNLSLSSKSESLYPVFHDLADRAYFQSTALISAANNVPAPSYPSLFSSVFSVAAHGEPDPWRLYYNPAPPVEFGAWGVDVPIAWKDGGSTVATGNSFAAPHVAGLVARILSKHPGLSPFELKAILASVADNPGRRHRPGAGR